MSVINRAVRDAAVATMETLMARGGRMRSLTDAEQRQFDDAAEQVRVFDQAFGRGGQPGDVQRQQERDYSAHLLAASRAFNAKR